MKKQLLSVLLAFCLALTLLPGTALAAEATGSVELADGNHDLWIDRLRLPGYARNFYDLLAEATDNDGYNDYLIEDRYADFSSSDVITDFSDLSNLNIGDYVNVDVTNSEGVRQTWAGVLVTKANTPVSDDEHRYIVQHIFAAWGAFDCDYSDVFWLSGYNWIYNRTSHGVRYYFATFFDPGQVAETSYYAVAGDDETERHMCISDPFAPQIQPLGDAGFSVRDTDENGDVYTEAAIKAGIAERDRNIARILETVPEGVSRYEQVRALNRWLVENNEYNSIVGANPDNYDKSSVPRTVWECVSALAGKEGTIGPVCDAYARAFKALCKHLDIPCVYTRSRDHAWNYVQMDDGKWYGIDTTWNDTSRIPEKYLLVHNNQIVDEKNNKTFLGGHPYINRVGIGYNESINLTNGPEEGPDAATGPYLPPPSIEEFEVKMLTLWLREGETPADYRLTAASNLIERVNGAIKIAGETQRSRWTRGSQNKQWMWYVPVKVHKSVTNVGDLGLGLERVSPFAS